MLGTCVLGAPAGQQHLIMTGLAKYPMSTINTNRSIGKNIGKFCTFDLYTAIRHNILFWTVMVSQSF